MAVKVREDVPLEELLLAVEWELLGADGADLPVAFHMLLEAALLKVGREDHFAQWAALVNVIAEECRGEGGVADTGMGKEAESHGAVETEQSYYVL